MTKFKQKSLLLLLAVLCTSMAWAQQSYRINRQRLCIEGVTFVKKASVTSQNYLFMEDFSIAAGETKTIPVYLTSSMPIWMFQADVVLPDGLTATSIDFSSAFYGSTAASQYSVESGMMDGNFRILVMNTIKTKSIPAGTRQHLFDITIKAASWLTSQSLTAGISSFEFIEAGTGNDETYEGGSTTCTVTVIGSQATGITLNHSELSTYVGDQTTLTATVTPSTASQTVAWASSKTSVATVNQNGVVTAVGEGTAVITATTTDGSNLTATCIVTVNRRLATSISVSPTSATLSVGGTQQLTATVLPSGVSQNVTWTSSNTAIATVSSTGLVTAKAVGTATIRATTTDGSNLSATCAVTVTTVKATSISLNYSEANLEMQSTLALTATVLPAGASQNVRWKSSSSAIASVDNNGVVTGLGVGNVTITATTTDGTNLSASCLVHVSRPLASSLTLNPSELLLEVDESTQIEAILSPDIALKTLQWSSSNTNVATVNQNGYVNGVGEGYAVIIANTVDGSNLTATCLVNVVNNRVRGDVNHDGVVDIFDVNLVINLITHMIPDDTYSRLADIDGNGAIDIFDLNIIINIMLELDKEPEAPNTYTVNGVAFRMVSVEGGTFTMGATPEQGSDAKATEKPAHQVTLSDYAIGETEVTQALWQAVMGSNPSANASSAALPVETVSWNDCQTFIARLNQLTGLTFRLPTEAEWEYAARGGNLSNGTKYAGSNDLDEVAWWKENSGIQTHPVGQKKPNELGLYDMSGNVYEMVADWYGAYTSAAQTNPTGAASGTMRVSRGGGCNRDQIGQRVSFRGTTSPTTADFVMGLRLAM